MQWWQQQSFGADTVKLQRHRRVRQPGHQQLGQLGISPFRRLLCQQATFRLRIHRPQGQTFELRSAHPGVQTARLLRIALRHTQLHRLPAGLGADKTRKTHGNRRQQRRRVVCSRQDFARYAGRYTHPGLSQQLILRDGSLVIAQGHSLTRPRQHQFAGFRQGRHRRNDGKIRRRLNTVIQRRQRGQ
ncbi:hypothetical protein D3C81_1047630 [compost metagenome]